MMGCASSSLSDGNASVNETTKEIDEEIKKDKARQQSLTKMLLLGAG